MKKHTILIAGATGLVGAAAVEHFATLEDWDVIAVSRRAMALPPGVRHMSVDLTDRQACDSAAANLTHVTHILFAALFELPELVAGWRDPRQMAVNEAMLKNLMDTVGVQAKGLRLMPADMNGRLVTLPRLTERRAKSPSRPACPSHAEFVATAISLRRRDQALAFGKLIKQANGDFGWVDGETPHINLGQCRG